MVNKDNVFYVSTLVEYTARKTKNHRDVIVTAMGEDGIRHQLEYADVNHCLSLEQVSDEVIREYQIPLGDFDSVSGCRYRVPSASSIGKVYATLVMANVENNPAKTVMDVFSSFLSDAISNFNSDMFYQNPSYLQACYKAGKILE